MRSNIRTSALPLILFVLLTFLYPPKTTAQIDLTGFIRNYNAVQTLPEHQILIGRNRVRLDLNRALSEGEIRISNDVQNLYTSEIDSIKYRLREAYANLYFSNSDLRIGRQIVSWGRADGAIITDILTPVDLSEFLTQDFSDIRMGVTALSYTRYFGSNYLQFVANPVFNPNETPRPGDRWFPRTFFNANIPVSYVEFQQDLKLKDIQLAVRWAFRSNLDFDLDIGYLYWHYPNPEYRKELITPLPGEAELQLEETFTKSHILTYSGTLQLTDGLLLTSEGAFYGSRSFDYLTEELRTVDYENPSLQEQIQLNQAFENNGDGFLMESPWFIGMVGLQFDWADWTISGQFINESILDYDSQMLQDRHYSYATLLLQRSFLRDKFSFRGFGRYNFNGDDFWLNPELIYQGIDNIEASAGTQLFGGAEPEKFYGHITFDHYAQNSFAYLSVTAYF